MTISEETAADVKGRQRRRADVTSPLPPLVPFAQCWSNHAKGIVGHLPISRTQLEHLEKHKLVPIVRIGPRGKAIPRDWVLNVQQNGLPQTPRRQSKTGGPRRLATAQNVSTKSAAI